MLFTMTTKPILNCFLFSIICSSAFAQVGERCIMKTTGAPGVCLIAANCPIVQEQAQNGISPTICGYYHLTVPIVCCENSFDDSSQSYERQPTYSENTQSSRRRPNYPENSQTNGNSRSQNQPEPHPNTFLNREPPDNPDALIYPDNDNERPIQSNNERPFQSNNERPVQTNQQYLSKSEQKCQEYSKAVTGVVQAIPLVTNTEAVTINFVKCDYNGVALIVGGKPASAGEFPFMAAIGFYIEDKIEWRCGGTLISEEYVLTAAHCTFLRDGDTPKIVRLGDLDLSRDDDGSVYADYNIRNIIVHPRYKYPLKYYDIALLRLSSTVKFTKFIRPACLYTKSQIEVPQAIATGWGKTDYAAIEISDKLMKVSLNIYSNDQCAQTFQVNKQLPQGIKSNMICAGELRGGMDTCQGDSGGPLLITKKGNQCQFYVIGITSFGKSCGQANTPAIYTKVSDFVPWIERTIW